MLKGKTHGQVVFTAIQQERRLAALPNREVSERTTRSLKLIRFEDCAFDGSINSTEKPTTIRPMATATRCACAASVRFKERVETVYRTVVGVGRLIVSIICSPSLRGGLLFVLHQCVFLLIRGYDCARLVRFLGNIYMTRAAAWSDVGRKQSSSHST